MQDHTDKSSTRAPRFCLLLIITETKPNHTTLRLQQPVSLITPSCIPKPVSSWVIHMVVLMKSLTSNLAPSLMAYLPKIPSLLELLSHPSVKCACWACQRRDNESQQQLRVWEDSLVSLPLTFPSQTKVVQFQCNTIRLRDVLGRAGLQCTLRAWVFGVVQCIGALGEVPPVVASLYSKSFPTQSPPVPNGFSKYWVC